MGTKYSTILVGGVVQTYNDNNPADDGSQTEANRVKYVTITDDLSAPLHSAITRLDGKLVDHVDEGPTAKSGAYTTIAADHNSVIECSGTFTVSLLNPTGNVGYQVTVKNASTGTITVDVDGGANVDGAASIALAGSQARKFYVNSGATAYYSTAGRPALGTAGQILGSDGTDVEVWANRIERGTAKSAPGDFTTSTDFTGLPAWAKRVTVMFSGMSLTGTDAILVQLGDSGGIETTGYASTSTRLSAAAQDDISSTSGFAVWPVAASTAATGSLVIENIDGNGWVGHGTGRIDADNTIQFAGSKTLSGVLTQLRVTRSGTDTFDAGTVNILYE